MTTPLRTLLTLLLLTPAAAAQDFVTTFDEVSAPGPFAFVFPGLNNGPLLDYPGVVLDGGVILSDALFGNSATTAPNIYATCDTCGLGDNPPSGLPGKITGDLVENASLVSLDLYNGFGGGGSFTLTAFGPTGAVVDTDVVFAGAYGTPAFQQQLTVSAPEIASFEVTTNLGAGYTFAIDTLSVTLAAIGTPQCPVAFNSTGSAAILSATGSTSVAANQLTLHTTSLPANTFGLFFYGPQAIQQPFGDGIRCVGGSVARLAAVNSGAGGAFSSPVDFANPTSPAGAIAPGDTRYFQTWFRDVPAGGAGFNLSGSLAITFVN